MIIIKEMDYQIKMMVLVLLIAEKSCNKDTILFFLLYKTQPVTIVGF